MSLHRTPDEIREATVRRCLLGDKVEAVADDLGVSQLTVYRWMREAGYYPVRTTRWVREMR